MEREVTQEIPDEFDGYRDLPEKRLQVGGGERRFTPDFRHFRGFHSPLRRQKPASAVVKA